MNGMARLVPVRDNQEVAQLVANAKAEDHGIFAPTHAVKKNGESVGYFSVGTPGYPVIMCWFGEKLTPRESFELINSVENMLAMQGIKGVCFPVPKVSPFYPLMESMGFSPCGEYEFFAKTF